MNATLGPAVVTIDAASGTEEKLELDPARLAAGSPMPEQFVRNAYTDTSGRFFAGIWRSSVGAWRVTLYGERTVRPDRRSHPHHR